MRRGRALALVSISGTALAAGAVLALHAGTASGVPARTSHQSSPPPRAIASRPTTREAWTARILYRVAARRAPTKRARVKRRLSPQAAYNKGPQVLLVLNAHASRRNGVWYLVRLPTRPNDSAAWVPAESVRVRKTAWRVLVDLSSRTSTLYRAGRRAGRWRVAVGTSANPTPTGRFAISEVVRQRRTSGFFGPAILTLTAHSENLSDFDGGDGRSALHGTNLPQLLGRAVSYGCVRFPNGAASKMARVLPPGAPVDIVD